MRKIKLSQFSVGKDEPLTVISGPCVIESRAHAFECAAALKTLAEELEINLIFKASFDKANRSSIHSFRGPGLKEGLEILKEIKETYKLIVTTDIHAPEQAKPVAEVCEILQIPAFLCRQTDLLVAATETGAVVNVKKGQFMAPWDMKNAIEKIKECGGKRYFLTERGTTFGYNNLVTDMRSIPLMQKLGSLVCFDASHSVQLPGGAGHASSGNREFIPHLTKAAMAVGADLLFIESHPNPSEAKCDKDTVFPLDELKNLLLEIKPIYGSLIPC